MFSQLEGMKSSVDYDLAAPTLFMWSSGKQLDSGEQSSSLPQLTSTDFHKSVNYIICSQYYVQNIIYKIISHKSYPTPYIWLCDVSVGLSAERWEQGQCLGGRRLQCGSRLLQIQSVRSGPDMARHSHRYHILPPPPSSVTTLRKSQQRTFLVWKEVGGGGGGNVSKCRINLGKQVNSKKVSLIDYCWCGKSSQWRGLSLKGGGPTRLAHWNPSQSNMEQSSHQSSWNSVFEMEFQKPLQ